jgi:CrcB protein
MEVLKHCLAIGLAGSLGALARFGVGHLCSRLFPTAFPLGTLIINVTGSFVLGWFAIVATQRATLSETTRLAVAVGFLGAYTTFSTLMYDTATLAQRGQALWSAANLILSLALGLAAVRLGAACARGF